MSGIAGIYYLNQRPVSPDDLRRMVDVMAHRGPDGSAIWCEGHIGLGHRILRTTPESFLEKLPLTKGNLSITADARIDNRDELISLLSLGSYSSEKITDSDIILAAYQKWRNLCPSRLLGDFSFAIWDARAGTIFCARDSMGVKPFYYYLSANTFIFASEIKALLCLQEVPHQLNETRVADYLSGLFEDRAITFYQGINRLPAANSLVVQPEKEPQLSTYWCLTPSQEIRLSSNEEYAAAFLEMFERAVNRCLRSSFPVGSALSGGLDSSSVACTARNLLAKTGRDQLHTFSAIFPSLVAEDLAKIDERLYMDAVTAMGDIQHHPIRADQMSPIPNLDQLLWYQEEPFPPPNLYLRLAMYEVAKQHNVRVVLDGTDGDSTVSHGWELLPELARTGRWKSLFSETSAISLRYGVPQWRVLRQKVLKPLFPKTAHKAEDLFRKRHLVENNPYPIINASFAQRIGLAERIQSFSHTSNSKFTARESHVASLASPLFQLVFEMDDRAAAAYSVESRHPFFDRSLMEFCVSLPTEQKLQKGWGRAVMRNAMTNILPSKVQWRPGKGNLSPNYRRKLLEYEAQTMEKVLIEDYEFLEDYIDITALHSELRNYMREPMKANAMMICSAITLGSWLKKFHSKYLIA